MCYSDINKKRPLHWLKKEGLQQKLTLEFLFSDPPQCFCKEPAHREYTLEYGPILECASFGFSKIYDVKYTCGFHVHELSWIKSLQELKKDMFVLSVNFRELQICPVYNFTFCTLFRVGNDFKKNPPGILPNCYCGYPTQLSIIHQRNNYSQLVFNCGKKSSKGAKKCWFHLNAERVIYTKPTSRLHAYVDYEFYKEKQEAPSSLSIMYRESLTGSPLNRLSFVPTPVLAKRQSATSSPALQQLILDSSLTQRFKSLQSSVSHIKFETDWCLKKTDHQLSDYKEAINNLLAYDTDEIKGIKLKIEQEKQLKEQLQERMLEVKESIELFIEQKKIREKLDKNPKEFTNWNGINENCKKCKLCYTKEIETLVVPCFHYVYCSSCANLIERCAICRRAIQGRHKIYKI